MPICDAALSLIIDEEVTDERTYREKYQHFDWPGGKSGPTVGIGYDCGYCKPNEIRADWAGILSEAQIAVLVSAAGITRGKAASWVKAHKRDITITWEQARRQIVEREIPKWEARLADAVPNVRLLPEDCYGALLSLAYNRGASFTLDGDRYTEMRAIRAHMAAQSFAAIPAEIRSMKRIWRGTDVGNGLCARRDAEADLFAKGLATLRRAPGLTPPAPEAQWPDADVHLEIPDPSAPPKVTVKEAAGSPTLWALMAAAVAKGLETAGHWIDWLFGGLPDVVNDTQAMLSPVQSLGGMVGGFLQDPRLLTTLTFVGLGYAAWRRFKPRGA
jgi:GH24 family phage-related lysozyme (muramidase)